LLHLALPCCAGGRAAGSRRQVPERPGASAGDRQTGHLAPGRAPRMAARDGR
jgi:hypothetical protein